MVCKIFDIMFVYGVDSLVEFCLAVIEIFYEDIKECDDLISFNKIISNGGKKKSRWRKH